MGGEFRVTSDAVRDVSIQNSPLTTHCPLSDSSLLRLLALRRSSSQLSPVADPLAEVGAVEAGAPEEQEGADHHGDRAVPPGVTSEKGGGHADHAEHDGGLAAEVPLGASAAEALALVEHLLGQPGIGDHPEAQEGDEAANDERDGLYAHERAGSGGGRF